MNNDQTDGLYCITLVWPFGSDAQEPCICLLHSLASRPFSSHPLSSMPIPCHPFLFSLVDHLLFRFPLIDGTESRIFMHVSRPGPGVAVLAREPGGHE